MGKKTIKEPKEKIEVSPEEETTQLEEVPTIKLVSMTMGATIPTMQYGNITASYTIECESIEVGEAILLSRITNLFDNYTQEARAAKQKAEVLPVVQIPKDEPEPVVPTTTERSQAYLTAEAYGNNAKTPEAVALWKTQVANSKKLTDAEKAELLK
jgi:hypothetical protein